MLAERAGMWGGTWRVNATALARVEVKSVNSAACRIDSCIFMKLNCRNAAVA